MNLCPICASGAVTTRDGQCKCHDCGSEWVQPPEPTFAYPYPLDSTAYIIERTYPAPLPQAVTVIGYHLLRHGNYAEVKDDYGSCWVLLDRLFGTKEDCERSVKNDTQGNA